MDKQIVVFTDLDGSLLDHNSYSYKPALPCLTFIRENNIPLIYTSSKTAVEIEQLCHRSDFHHPYIAENGGLLGTPKHYFSETQTSTVYTKNIIGIKRETILQILKTLKPSFNFKSFHDMSIDELVEHTGLKHEDAVYAKQRDSTEPLLWLDDELKLDEFASHLEPHSLTLVRGGRFQHVMGEHDKATTMQLLIEQFKQHKDQPVISIALGDSPNDLKMLKTATHSILITNPHAPKMCDVNHANLLHAEHPGPQGWNDSLFALLKELIT